MMKYLYKTPEGQLVDRSLNFPISPLAQIFNHLDVPYPYCWIRLRKRSSFLEKSLCKSKIKKNFKMPGDFDIIAGPLVDWSPTDYIIGIEVKRFSFILKNNRWVLKKPYSFGEKQVIGYTLYGFNKVMLYHFVVAEPILLTESKDGRVWIDNSSIVNVGMDAVKRLEIIPDDPCGYCIGGWSQIPHKDPNSAGGIPAPYIIKPTPDNPNANKKTFQNVRDVLLDRMSKEIRYKIRKLRKSIPLPLIISFRDII